MSGPLIVVGPGAVGCLLAAYWSKAGVPVALLGRTAQSEKALVSGGILISAPDGAPICRARSLRAARGLPASAQAGAAFICVNGDQVGAAIRAARPWIGAETVIVGLSNGGRRALRAAFGVSRLVEGVVKFGALRRAPGDVVHAHGREILLAPAGRGREAFTAAKALLEKGGWTVSEGRRARPSPARRG